MCRPSVLRHVAIAVSAVLLLALPLIACGGDPYSGTWESTDLFVDQNGATHRSSLVIEKSADADGD